MLPTIKNVRFGTLVIFQAWHDVRPIIRISLGRSYVTLFTFAVTFLMRLLTKLLMMNDWVGEVLIFIESVAMLLEFVAFCIFSILDLVTFIRASVHVDS